MRDKTLIIGAGGRLGQILHAQWRDRGDCLWTTRSQWAAADGPEKLRPWAAQADVILCLAGATPAASDDFTLNREIGDAVCSVADGAHVFLASSVAVYGAMEHPAKEDDAPCAPNTYGVAKTDMENSAAASNACVTSLRLGNVVGADMLGRNIKSGAKIKLDIFPNGAGPKRSYIDPERLAFCVDRLFALARAGRAMPKALNVANIPSLDMADIARASRAEFEQVEAPEQAIPVIEMDTTRLIGLVPEMAAPVSATQAVAAQRRVEALL